MTEAVKEVAPTITDNKHVDVHLAVYNAVKDNVGFSPVALMVA